jgi:hypothetical protein
MMLLAIDFTSMTWSRQNRLVEGYALSEINKYSLKQLRRYMHCKLESKKGLKPDITAVL